VAAYVPPIFGDQLGLAYEASLNILILDGTTKSTATLKLFGNVSLSPFPIEGLVICLQFRLPSISYNTNVALRSSGMHIVGGELIRAIEEADSRGSNTVEGGVCGGQPFHSQHLRCAITAEGLL
jgi:hypothetical protein